MTTHESCHCGKDGHALNSVNCPVHGYDIVPKTPQDWEERFDEKFQDLRTNTPRLGDNLILLTFIKSFISRLLAEQAAAFVAGLPGKVEDETAMLPDDELKLMKKAFGAGNTMGILNNQRAGYNACRQQTLDNWKKKGLV
jgi:hypothetical protein